MLYCPPQNQCPSPSDQQHKGSDQHQHHAATCCCMVRGLLSGRCRGCWRGCGSSGGGSCSGPTSHVCGTYSKFLSCKHAALTSTEVHNDLETRLCARHGAHTFTVQRLACSMWLGLSTPDAVPGVTELVAVAGLGAVVVGDGPPAEGVAVACVVEDVEDGPAASAECRYHG